MNDVPVAIDVPPVKTVYQFMVPAEAVAPRVTVPAPHLNPVFEVVIVGMVLIVAKISVLVPVIQPLSVAST